LSNKYRSDPLFRTEIHVLSLQITFTLMILLIIDVSFGAMYSATSRIVATAMRAGAPSLAGGALEQAIIERIERAGDMRFFIVAGIITLATILFGYIVARVALTPVRNSLASQKRFIGNIAHELRTPLSVIKMNTELALFNRGLDNDLKTALESNLGEIDRISGMINNLLALSVLVRPEQMKFSAVDLSALVSRVVLKFEALAGNKRLRIKTRTDDACLVPGNETALEQIAGNILKNAVHYTPAEGRIEIIVRRSSGAYAEFIVKDSGIGISRKNIFHIFEPFYRVDRSGAHLRDGNGLGLTMVSELVKMHKGKITIRSALGRGTSVTILLPLSEKHKNRETENADGANGEVSIDFLGQTPA